MVHSVQGTQQVEGDGIWRPGLRIVFFGIMVFVMGRYLIAGVQQVRHRGKASETSQGASEVDRPPVGFPMPSPRRFLQGSFQRQFESAAQAHFPFSETTLTRLYCRLAVAVSDLPFVRMSVSMTVPRPVWDKYRMVRDAEGDRILGPPTLRRDTDRALLRARASYYNGLHAACPAVHFYVLPLLPVADWWDAGELYGADAKKLAAGDSHAGEFRRLLDPAIGYTWAAEGCSRPQVMTYYFRTDHHMNFRGAYQAYRQVWQLMHQKDGRTGSAWEPQRWFEVPGLRYRGSLSQRAGYYDALSDELVDAVFDLPEYKIRIHGFPDTPRNAKAPYQAGHYSRAKFVYHYAKYFGDDYGLIEYTCDAGTYGNLLVISDSYDNCIEPLLACHFLHAYFVDPRLYATDVGEEFNLDRFVAEHKITDVLFLGGQAWILGLQPLEPYGSR
jgi:hypothetical protein